MKIFVCIKQVPDTETKIKLSPDRNSVDSTGVKWVINPYDEFAIEEALKLKQQKPEAQVIIITVGPKKRASEAVRTALAMGADEGIVVDSPEFLDSSLTAKVLAKVIQGEGTPFMVFTGKLSIDNNAACVTQSLAENLSIPHTTVVSKFVLNDGSSIVEREVEGGSREIVQLIGPAVVGANKGLNQPRYASLPGIMKAKKKTLKELDLISLGFSESDIKMSFINYELPQEKPAVKLLSGDLSLQSFILVKLLREEAKII
jgi:electron transfer flavoprotein beta subunit